MMEQFLKEERLGTDYRGLYRTRNRFLILCVVAFCTHSTRLASALGSFVEHKVRRIVEYEEPLHLPEWCLGLCELRNLVPDGWDFPPYYGHYPLRPHHGRRALLELPGWDPRALPAAGLRRFRSLDDLRVGRPLQSAWPSPSMSPTRLPVNDYLDEAEAIQCEQLAQAIELEAVKRRVKQLEYMR
ncbi:hypothetical protein CC86DRAFT_359518 [Ophiobolus disseminans]|uniref:Uncharacterized protein n=1 Tax=Ophiobolus disseminans TaxID=1469910 RepID=A0A6A6ZIL0_9PLEO|nr:hypothetical protein CC86DRAFT_359518 [Ophiobolus disseminans]